MLRATFSIPADVTQENPIASGTQEPSNTLPARPLTRAARVIVVNAEILRLTLTDGTSTILHLEQRLIFVPLKIEKMLNVIPTACMWITFVKGLLVNLVSPRLALWIASAVTSFINPGNRAAATFTGTIGVQFVTCH